MFLESSLLGEDAGIISTGLGGKGNKLRHYFVISSKNDSPFSREQEEVIEEGSEIWTGTMREAQIIRICILEVGKIYFDRAITLLSEYQSSNRISKFQKI